MDGFGIQYWLEGRRQAEFIIASMVTMSLREVWRPALGEVINP